MGDEPIDITKLTVVATILIVLPLLLDKIPDMGDLRDKIEPVRGFLAQRSYFLILYTIVALSRNIITGQSFLTLLRCCNCPVKHISLGVLG